jgi:hypothetical protein
MKTALFAGLALCLALQPGSPAAQEPQLPRIHPSQRQQAEIERLQEEIQGLWRIERIRMGNSAFQGGQLNGYVLAASNYLSMEYHVENFTQDGGFDGVEYLFQTGIYEYRFSALGELELVTRIGTINLDGTMPTFDRAGRRKRYTITLGLDRMKLETETGSIQLIRVSRPPHTTDKDERRGG